MNSMFSGNAKHTRFNGQARITFSERHLIRALLVAGGAYLFFFLAALLLADDGEGAIPAMVLVHFGAAISFLAYWRLGRWGSSRYASFGAGLLLVSAGYRVHAALDTLIYGLRIEDIPGTVPFTAPVIWWFLKGELISHIGVLLLVSAWRVSIGGQVERFSFQGRPGAAPIRLLLVIYCAGLLANLANKLLPGIFGVFEQLASLTFTFAVASIYFIASRQARTTTKVFVAGVLSLPMVALALGAGMKEQIFFPLVPAAILFLFGYRSLIIRLCAVVLGLLVLAFSQLYVGYVRDTTWRVNAKAVPVLVTLANFGHELESMDIRDGVDKVSSRINMTSAHAVTVSLADHHGFQPVEVFGLIPASFIPRMFWPNKPVIQPGAMQTARIRGLDIDLSNISSATATGFFTELYLGGSVPGLLLGAWLYGWLLARAQRWVASTAPGFGHQAFAFVVIYWALRLDETAVVYAYTSIVFTVVFVWLMKRAFAAFGLSMEVSRAAAPR